MNDVIDYIQPMPRNPTEFTRSAKAVFVATSLMPTSFGIYTDFLAGNIPLCFVQLRMMIESMAVYFTADKEHNQESFFYDKIVLSKKAQDLQGVRISKVISAIDEDAAKVWHRCSQWVHPQDLAKKFVNYVAEHGAPSWSLALPMEYDSIDEPAIEELGSELALFRRILSRMMNNWE